MQASAANECEKHLLGEMSNKTLSTPATTVSDNAENSTFVTTTDPVPTTSSSSSCDVDVWSFFDAKVIETMTTQTTKSECLVEMKRYLCVIVIDGKLDPLECTVSKVLIPECTYSVLYEMKKYGIANLYCIQACGLPKLGHCT
uniref:Uncharacterized protein n=1 Tax=Amphimedon queenslandica TaxID=400682 RepID=A0A1X7VAS1_AMPQE